MKSLANLTTQQRREILETYLKSGKVARVRWSTAKSGLTERNVKLWMEKSLTSQDRNVVMPNPTRNNPLMLTAVDLAKVNDLGNPDWVNINLTAIEWMKLGSEEWKI